MGVSVQYVPRVTSYAQAVRLYEKTKPIRGTDKRPLGRRRDHHTYSIRKNADGCMELVNYNTPVVTLDPPTSDAAEAPDTPQFFRIKLGGWSSVSTRQFVEQTLGIRTSGKGRYSVLHIRGDKYTIKGSEELTLSLDRDGWHVHNPAERTSYRINRKASNNVRARYKKFADYIKGMVSLRTEEKGLEYTEYLQPVITFSCEELASVFGVRRSGTPVHAFMLSRPGVLKGYLWPKQVNEVVDVQGTDLLMQHESKYYVERGTQLIQMMLSDDAEQMHKALVWLGVQNMSRTYGYEEGAVLYRPAECVQKNFKEFILRWHADETVEAFPTPLGQMPAEKYKSWVGRHKNT